MAEIINLRRARKAKDKAVRESQAAENRLLFGRSKAEREQLTAEKRLVGRRIEGHRLESKDEPEAP